MKQNKTKNEIILFYFILLYFILFYFCTTLEIGQKQCNNNFYFSLQLNAYFLKQYIYRLELATRAPDCD